MFEWMLDIHAWVALLTLTLLEIVLGIDNIIFITIIVGRLPLKHRDKARVLGLALAMITRIALLASLFWIMKLTTPLFSILKINISGRDLVLILGGIFLVYKGIEEIYLQIKPHHSQDSYKKPKSFISALVQIAILDIVFSLDSVITAVGMANHLEVMILAIILAVIVMMFASKGISNFVETHLSIKTLALGFLILVGIALIADGFSFEIPKAYIYFALGFSLAVECLNIYINKKTH